MLFRSKGERENSIELNGDRRERGAFIAVATQSGPRSSSVSGDAERAVNEGAGGTCASALNNNSVGPRTEVSLSISGCSCATSALRDVDAGSASDRGAVDRPVLRATG